MKRGQFKPKTYQEKIAILKAKQDKVSKSPRKPRKTPQNGKIGRSKGKKKTKKPSMRQLKDKLWKECKRIIRERHGNVCYTCGYAPLEGANWQTGHGKAKGSLPLQYKFDLRNLRPQCRACNIYRNGETDIFISKLEIEKEGLAFLEEACYFDKDWHSWRIRQDIKSLGGIQAEEFIRLKIVEYRAVEN